MNFPIILQIWDKSPYSQPLNQSTNQTIKGICNWKITMAYFHSQYQWKKENG
jgi:hypothetical protein